MIVAVVVRLRKFIIIWKAFVSVFCIESVTYSQGLVGRILEHKWISKSKFICQNINELIVITDEKGE